MRSSLFMALLVLPMMAGAESRAGKEDRAKDRAQAEEKMPKTPGRPDVPEEVLRRKPAQMEDVKGGEKAEAARAAGLEKAHGRMSEEGAEHSKADQAPGAVPGDPGAPPGEMDAHKHKGHGHAKPAEVMHRLLKARGNASVREMLRKGRHQRLVHQMRHGDKSKGVAPAAIREELRRNARRLARLARVRELAENAKDSATLERVDALIERETERHVRWMGKHDLRTDMPDAPSAPDAPATPNAPDTEGGAQ